MILDPKGAKTFEAYIKTADDVSNSVFSRIFNHEMKERKFLRIN